MGGEGRKAGAKVVDKRAYYGNKKERRKVAMGTVSALTVNLPPPRETKRGHGPETF